MSKKRKYHTWVHTLLKKQLPEGWELKQCLFGEHLLTKYPDKPVVLVEAEKTALIGAALMPECNWLATGGKGQLNDRVDVLEGRKVVAFPEADISLYERCRRINVAAMRNGIADTAVVSVHVNAAGKGDRWYDATGWCAYTFPGDSRSDKLATCLYKSAKRYLPGKRLRTDYSDGDPDFEAPFYILKHTYCSAVLTENLFMDGLSDYRFLLSEEGKRAIVNLHVDGIQNWINGW